MSAHDMWVGDEEARGELQRRLSPRAWALAGEVARRFELPEEYFLGPTQKPKPTAARRVVAYVMREGWGLSLGEIARQLDRDEAAILLGVRVITAHVAKRTPYGLIALELLGPAARARLGLEGSAAA